MQFAMVEVAKGIIEPLVLTGSRGDRLTGRHLTGDIVSFPVASVVHAGLTGDEPPVVYQFCPTWVAAAMRAAGVQRLRTAVAANPEGDEEDDGPKLIDPGQVKYQSGEMIVTADSRRTRRKEGELFRSLSKKTGGMWSGYEVGHEFGYDQIAQFIRQNREEQKPDTLLWCMIFAALTANEGTQDAERNLSGFTSYLRDLFATGIVAKRGMISIEQFASAWKSGLLQKKYGDFNNLLEGYDKLIPALAHAKAQGMRGSVLRRYVATTPGVGIPKGLGVTKFSFAMECWGENVGCLDRWMFRVLGANDKIAGSFTAPVSGMGPIAAMNNQNKKIALHRKAGPKEERAEMAPIRKPPWEPFSEGSYSLQEYGASRFSGRYGAPKPVWQYKVGGIGPWIAAKRVAGELVEPVEHEVRRLKLATEEQKKKQDTTPLAVVEEYEWWENKLTRTVYYQLALEEGKTDPRAALNPLARAQWTMWEDILRRHPDQTVQLDKARHMPLWIAINGLPNVIGRVLVPYREHREEGARKALGLIERTVGRAPGKGKAAEKHAAAVLALPGALSALREADEGLRLARQGEPPQEAPMPPPRLLRSKRNPGLGRVFSEALAWKRGEVTRASSEAKALASRLSERALEEFAAV